MGRVQRDGDRSSSRADPTAVHFGQTKTVEEAVAIHVTSTLRMAVLHTSRNGQAKHGDDETQQSHHGRLQTNTER